MPFTVQKQTDPQTFMADNKPVLLKNEAVNNQILGALQAGMPHEDGTLLLTIKLKNKTLGCALLPKAGQPLQVTHLPANAAKHLASYLHLEKIPLQGITGPRKTAEAFISQWQRETKQTAHMAMRLGVFTAKKAILPLSEGEAVVAGEAHTELLTSFCNGFINDCFPEEENIRDKADLLANMHLRNKTALLWLTPEGEFVAVAAKQRETLNMAAISMVYTPPQHRGKGYAKSVVAALTGLLIDSGYKKCVLFADLNNPITPDFYRKIGYSLVEESPRYIFESN